MTDLPASLAERMSKAATSARELSTLVVDIERLPGLARVWSPKTRYVHPDNFERWPSTLCFAAKWVGHRQVHFHSTWDDGAEGMHEAAFQLFNQADIVVTFNGVGFDIPHLQSGWAERRMGRPSTWKDVDLYKVVKATQGWEAKSLNEVCKRLGIPAKNDRYDYRVAEAAAEGDVKAQKRMRGYNVNDVRITEATYFELLPFVKSHPHVAPVAGMDRATCPRCGTTDVSRNGTYAPGTYVYAEYTCNACKGPFRTEYQHRGPSVRAL